MNIHTCYFCYSFGTFHQSAVYITELGTTIEVVITFVRVEL